VGEEVEALEDHSYFLADFVDIHFRVSDLFPIDPDVSRCRGFKKVQAAEEGTFSGT